MARKRAGTGGGAVGLAILALAGLVGLVVESHKPPEPRIDHHEGRTVEALTWINEGNGVASVQGTLFKIRKCADDKFVVEYDGQALNGGHHWKTFGEANSNSYSPDITAVNVLKNDYRLRYGFVNYNHPDTRILPLDPAKHHKPVCDQVNDPNDNPDDMLRYTPPQTVWQEESAGVWLLVYTSKWEGYDNQAHPIYTRYDTSPNATIKVNDCPLPNGIHLLAISENGQLISYAQDRSRGQDYLSYTRADENGWTYMGEEAESIIKSISNRNPIDNAPEFAHPRSSLPVCKQIVS